MRTLGIAALMGLLVNGFAARAADREKASPTPSLVVVGSGKAAAQPDTAVIQAGVVTQAQTAAKALEENSTAMKKLLQTLTKLGIADKDVQTSHLGVTPLFRRTAEGEQ